MLLLMGVSLTTAQQVPQPVLRLGNFIEVGNDLFMHIYVSTWTSHWSELTVNGHRLGARCSEHPQHMHDGRDLTLTAKCCSISCNAGIR